MQAHAHQYLQRLRLRLDAVDLECLLDDLQHVFLHDTGWTCNDTHEDANCLGLLTANPL